MRKINVVYLHLTVEVFCCCKECTHKQRKKKLGIQSIDTLQLLIGTDLFARRVLRQILNAASGNTIAIVELTRKGFAVEEKVRGGPNFDFGNGAEKISQRHW